MSNSVGDNPYNTYWVIPGKLLAGEYPGDKSDAKALLKLQCLIDLGIGCFIDLTEADERLRPYAHLLSNCIPDGARHVRFPVPDFGIPRLTAQMIEILDAIDSVTG